jgi:hypothetical protein
MDNAPFRVTPQMTAGALLLLALIPLVAGYIRGHQVRADAVAFAQEGVQTVGKVLNKTSEFVRNSQRYTVYFEYKGPDEVTYQESEQLPGSTSYDDYRVGGPITLTYLRSRPDHFYLPVYTPGEQYAHIFDVFFYIGGAGTLVALGWLALLWVGGSGGSAPAMPQPDGPAAPRSAPVRPRTTSPPQGFGRR